MPSHEILILAEKTMGSLFAKRFGTSVIERWTRHRAAKFYEGFVKAFSEEAREGRDPQTVDQLLQEILADEKRTEVLFDAYRSVTFARSKTIGPRIIGLLTAAIVIEDRSATEDEELIFAAAEELSDADLQAFVESYGTYSAQAANPTVKDGPNIKGGMVIIPWSKETRDSAWSHSREAEIDTTPIELAEALGFWASRLERLGFVSSKVTHREQEYKEDSERHIDQDGVLSIYSFSIIFQPQCKRLSALGARAIAMDSKNE